MLKTLFFSKKIKEYDTIMLTRGINEEFRRIMI